MCSPQAVVAAAQAVVGYIGARGEADAQNAYYDENRSAAVRAQSDRYASLNNKALSERAAAVAELEEKQIEALKATATARVSASEAGVTGLSVDALEGDFLAQSGRQRASIEQNFATKIADIQDEMVATRHNTISRISAVRQAARPSPIPYLIQAAAGSLKGSPTGAV
jgi:hypothetical protein